MRTRVGALLVTVQLTAAVVIRGAGTVAAAEPPDAATMVSRMKAALEPTQPTTRTVTLQISGGPGGGSSQVVAGQARKHLADGDRLLTVVLTPKELKGIALLVQQAPQGPEDVQWVYIPAIARVRKLVSSEACVHFLNSDFTYSDLGFVSTRPAYTVLGEAGEGATKAWEVQGVPQNTWCYSRFVTRIAKDSYLPLERRFYDPANQLWKIERWEEMVKFDGMQTPVKISMDDVQAKTRSDITISGVRVVKDLPDALFEPGQLPAAADSPVWSGR